jgi:hypothetical protein
MISYKFYSEFITSFHTHYNGEFLKPLSWCYIPKESDDGFIEFINRSHRNYIKTIFYAKYDFKNRNIIIKCEYYYFEHYIEKSETTFLLKGYKNSTYNYMNIHNKMINHLADEEILSFIKMFDQFFLEQINIPILKFEYDLYVKHLKNHPELTSNHNSDICRYKIDIYYHEPEQNIIVRFCFNDKINKYKDSIEFYLFKNRMVGDDFNDLNSAVNNLISTRMDEIYIDFIMFTEFRLK